MASNGVVHIMKSLLYPAGECREGGDTAATADRIDSLDAPLRPLCSGIPGGPGFHRLFPGALSQYGMHIATVLFLGMPCHAFSEDSSDWNGWASTVGWQNFPCQKYDWGVPKLGGKKWRENKHGAECLVGLENQAVTWRLAHQPLKQSCDAAL